MSFLGFEASPRGELAGWGGNAPMAEIQTRIRFATDDGGEATFRGLFAAAVDDSELDIAILGREITNLFAVIIDYPGNTVCLLRDNDRYQIIRGVR